MTTATSTLEGMRHRIALIEYGFEGRWPVVLERRA